MTASGNEFNCITRLATVGEVVDVAAVVIANGDILPVTANPIPAVAYATEHNLHIVLIIIYHQRKKTSYSEVFFIIRHRASFPLSQYNRR